MLKGLHPATPAVPLLPAAVRHVGEPAGEGRS